VLPNHQTMLRTLQAELNFLERGGYRPSSRSSWRSLYIFEESPSCPNFGNPARPFQCQHCWLLRFIPPDLHQEQVPCRFVQLSPDGTTVDALYRYGTPTETENALRKWLWQRIQDLNAELSEARNLPLVANG
jgi:hypothetical protein